jgi:hypothetical protein
MRAKLFVFYHGQPTFDEGGKLVIRRTIRTAPDAP